MKESKESRFKRLVEARVNKITAMLRLLGNCSFKGNYEYTEEQINKIFDKLYSELDKVHQRFTGPAVMGHLVYQMIIFAKKILRL